MAALVLNDARLLIAGYDLSGQMNAVALEYGAEMLDTTTFGNTTRINTGGLHSVAGRHEGLWDSSVLTAPDPALFPLIGAARVPVTISPTAAAAGELAYLFEAVQSEYSPAASVGELLGFSVAMEGAGGQPLIRGSVLHNAAATGNVTGTAYQLGAVAATEYLYGALHVFSGSGSFVVKIQSATDEAFTTPNDRITFTTVGTGTAIASQWAARVTGAITDTWWRAVATNPNTRNFAVVAGIQ